MRKGVIKLVALSLAMAVVSSTASYAKKSDQSYEEWEEEWGSQKIELSMRRIVLYLKSDREEREFQLEAEGDPNEEEFKWESSDEKIATVNNNGVVKARRAGQCTITVRGKESDVTATCTVEVRDDIVPIEEIKITNDGEVTVLAGKTKRLPFTLYPSNYTTPKKIYSSVADSDICEVDDKGNVRGKEEGDTTVTIWFNNVEEEENEENDSDSSSSKYSNNDITKDEAEFTATFEVTVRSYSTDGLNKFSEEYKGFSIRNKEEDEEYIWCTVDGVGRILYDAEEEKFCKGWVDIGKRRYHLVEKRVAPTSGEYEGKEQKFYVAQEGWVQEGSDWYLLEEGNGMMTRGWGRDNGKWYYCEESTGKMKTGMLRLGTKNYWLLDDGSAVERWYTHTDGNTYYGNPGTCELPQGWFLVDGKWYYADPKDFHVVKADWVLDEDGSWYYVTETGEMLVNAQTPDGYTVGADGRMVQ